jgi:hypothetical protein
MYVEVCIVLIHKRWYLRGCCGALYGSWVGTLVRTMSQYQGPDVPLVLTLLKNALPVQAPVVLG